MNTLTLQPDLYSYWDYIADLVREATYNAYINGRAFSYWNPLIT